MENFEKVHEIGQYNKKKVVDFHTNQAIEVFFIGPAQFFDQASRLSNQSFSPNDFVLYFSHYLNELLLVDNNLTITSSDLVRVDFINRRVVLEKNFFRD